MRENYYFAVGTRENWKRAFASGNVWGLPGDRKASWRRLKQGDVVFFYVQIPISRIVGYGSVVAKSIADDPIFFEDWGGVTEWPLRFNFEIIWPPVGPFSGPWIPVEGVVDGRTRKKFHELGYSRGQELLRRCQVALR